MYRSLGFRDLGWKIWIDSLQLRRWSSPPSHAVSMPQATKPHGLSFAGFSCDPRYWLAGWIAFFARCYCGDSTPSSLLTFIVEIFLRVSLGNEGGGIDSTDICAIFRAAKLYCLASRLWYNHCTGARESCPTPGESPSHPKLLDPLQSMRFWLHSPRFFDFDAPKNWNFCLCEGPLPYRKIAFDSRKLFFSSFFLVEKQKKTPLFFP